MKFFPSYTKWSILETYNHEGTWFCVFVRLNKNSGMKSFKVKRITRCYHYVNKAFTKEMIEELYNE